MVKVDTRLNVNINIQNEARQLLERIKASGYIFTSFESENWEQIQQRIVLRHDIDFDCDVALHFAEMEAQIGVKATYYFLLNSDAYNLISPRNINIVKQIQSLGHDISLHFDPVGFDDATGQCQIELNIFSSVFGVEPKVISIHRPQKCLIREQSSSFNADHTYMALYNKGHSYFSDSGGRFKYGHPIDSDAFKQNQNLHLLIHPIWWADLSVDVMQKLDWLSQKKQQDMQQLMADNCIPYKAYLETKLAPNVRSNTNIQSLPGME
jgi:hypothetical protein